MPFVVFMFALSIAWRCLVSAGDRGGAGEPRGEEGSGAGGGQGEEVKADGAQHGEEDGKGLRLTRNWNLLESTLPQG